MKTIAFCAATLFAAPLLHGCPNTPIAQTTPTTQTMPKTQTTSDAIPQQTPNPKNADIPVSRANFVSLKWRRSGGYAGLQTQVLIHNGTIQLHRGAPDNKKPSQIKALDKAEFQAVLKLLNDAHFTKIVGKYNQPGLCDGFSDVVSLQLQKPDEKPQVFVVDNYGDAAPKAFHDVTEGLRALQNKKFTDQKN